MLSTADDIFSNCTKQESGRGFLAICILLPIIKWWKNIRAISKMSLKRRASAWTIFFPFVNLLKIDKKTAILEILWNYGLWTKVDCSH